MIIKNFKVKTIAQLQNDPTSTLLIDSQDTAELRERFPEYDGFFVKVEDGDYSEIWGFVGTVPYLSKIVSRLV